eukprot:CAMPEP_0115268914 /NCGR_PEP_ID=MMETSP0270-20121206/52763_1 /TAXON_ID=71861 /ORGANISM="Scrippsiella trochoidea, Strain CCMP3099" /LENGTH=109 /DNA_ID=CAMNT_0002685125 /DNA_START=5 /DNA_END=331 /DNA_ORIENTATION=-
MTAPVANWAHLGQQAAQGLSAASAVVPCDGPDCLPENSLVQVEGSTEPRELGDLRVGERVLCEDSLEKTTCYVRVDNVEMTDQSGDDPAEWVRLALSDGSSITMTADHP